MYTRLHRGAFKFKTGFTNAAALVIGEKGSDIIKNTYIKNSETDQSTNEIHEEL